MSWENLQFTPDEHVPKGKNLHGVSFFYVVNRFTAPVKWSHHAAFCIYHHIDIYLMSSESIHHFFFEHQLVAWQL